MGIKSIFTLASFVANISGEVSSPNNAIGEPNSTFTGNSDGSWTAKWALAAPDSPTKVTPYAQHSLRVFCRRANSSGGSTDPAVRSVIVRDAEGQPVYEFLAGAQITRFSGPLALLDSTLSTETKDFLLDMTLGQSMYPQTANSTSKPAMVRGAFLCADNTLFVLMGWQASSQLGRIFKIANFNTPQASVISWTPLGNISINVNLAQGWEAAHLRVSESNTDVGLPGVTTFWAFSEKEVSPGVTHLVRMSAPSGTAATVGGFAFSPDGEYIVITEAVLSAKLLVVGKRDLENETYTNISQSGLEVTNSNYNVTQGPVWVGNTVARPLRTGYYAWTWDSITETLTPIANVQGGMWSSTTMPTDLALSPDGRWLVAIYNQTSSATVYVEDLNNPGVSGRRTINTSMQRLSKPVWVPGKQAVIFLASRLPSNSVFSENNGHPVTLSIPTSGDLAWECVADFSYPFTAQHIIKSISFSNTHGVVVLPNGGEDSGIAPKTFAGTLRMFSLEENKIESKAVWELPAKQIMAPLSREATDIYGTYMYLDLGPRATSSNKLTAQNGAIRYSYNNGGYVLLRKSGSGSHVCVYPLNNIKKFGYVPPLALSIPVANGVSVSKDGLWVAADHRIYSVVHNGGVDWTLTDVTSGGIDSGLVCPAFRHAPDTDELPNLVAFFHTGSAPRVRIYEVTNPVDTPPYVYREDLSVPNPLHQINFINGEGIAWSHDGQYLYQFSAGAGEPRIWQFTGTGFTQLSLPSITYTSFQRLSMKWHPKENVALLRTSTSDGYLFYFLQCNGTSVTLINSSEFLNQIASIRERHYYADWEAEGKYLSINFGLNPETTSVGRWERHIYVWDSDKLVNNQPLEKLPAHVWEGTGGYFDQYLRATSSIDMSEYQRYDYLGSYMFGSDTDVAFSVATFQADPSVDFSNLLYNEGWTVEIDTWGDGNAIQVDGVELEIELDQFQLSTPTNLQTVASGGNRALVSWDWTA
jgi:hypothetical protein